MNNSASLIIAKSVTNFDNATLSISKICWNEIAD